MVVWCILSLPVKGAYDIWQEVLIGVCIQIARMGLVAFKLIVVLKVKRVGHFQNMLLLVKNLKLFWVWSTYPGWVLINISIGETDSCLLSRVVVQIFQSQKQSQIHKAI
jgi:hypothetical protein